LTLAINVQTEICGQKFHPHTDTKLYGLVLWKGKCVRLCGVDIAYWQLSDWDSSAVGIAQLAHAVGE